MIELALAAAALAVMAGAAAQSMTGVGFGLIAAPAVLLVAPHAGPLPVLVASVVVLAVTFLDNRRGWRPAPVALMVAGSIPGVVAGAILLGSLDPAVTGIAIGATIVAVGVASLAGLRLPRRRALLIAAGTVAGALNSLASVPGPALALVYRPEDAAEFRANLSAAFLAMTALSIAATSATHPPTADTLLLSTAVTVLAVAGQLIGRKPARRVRTAWVRRGAIILSVVAGAVLLASSITAAAAPGVR